MDAAGNVIEVTAAEILGTEEDSVIYRHDGTLTSMRYMTMDGYNLYFVEGTDTTVITSDGRIAIGRGYVTPAQMSGRQIRLDVNGDILAQQIHSSSDERFKKNIQPITGALNKVMSLEGVNYQFRVDEFADRTFPTTTQMGFIAQNVEGVAPEVVATHGDGYKAVDYAKLTALLTEAIKEQQAKINTLEAQLAEANGQNEKLASDVAEIKQLLQKLSSHNMSAED